MTKIVVGVDNLGAYRPVVGLLERLRFPEPQVSLLHSARETLPYTPAFESSREVEARYAETTTALGNAALGEATALACSKGLPCEARLVHGNPADALIHAAQAWNADLIAVNTNPAGVARTSYIGSVPRALTIGSPTSVLFAKGEKGVRGTFRAVFATDHSPFAERCLARLLELAPGGIQEIHVVSAFRDGSPWSEERAEGGTAGEGVLRGPKKPKVNAGPVSIYDQVEIEGPLPLTPHPPEEERQSTEAPAFCVPPFGGPSSPPEGRGGAGGWIEERNAAVCARLEAAGYMARSIVTRGKPNEAIHHAMARVRADLLIVGSQGAGAMTRDLIGSVSLHQVTAEMYPVLVVRPRESA